MSRRYLVRTPGRREYVLRIHRATCTKHDGDRSIFTNDQLRDIMLYIEQANEVINQLRKELEAFRAGEENDNDSGK